MLTLMSRVGSLLRPASIQAARCTACSASASVRAIHVEAHLERIGVKLPVAIVPPQGILEDQYDSSIRITAVLVVV